MVMIGWDSRIRTYECWSQSPVPYRLAISQYKLRTNMIRGHSNLSEWCGVTGSNRRPIGCKPIALPAELTPHILKK